MSRPIAVDLFAGAGGLSLGFEQAGYEVAAAVEIDPVHAAVHKFNFPNCAVFPVSVVGLTGAEIRRASSIGDKKVDVVIGGAPCQGFSLIGSRAMDDPRNRLVKEFVRITKELDASYFVFENVKGITVGKHIKFLNELIEEFSNVGYEVRLPWTVLNASSFGVPQDRQRLILLGCKQGLELPDYPLPTTWQAGTEKIKSNLPYGPSCGDALGDIPDAELFQELESSDSVCVEWGQPSFYGAIMRGLKRQPDDFSYRRSWDPNILTSSMRTTHTAISRRRFSETQEGTVEPISRFYRLHRDGVCNTLRAGTDGARGAFTSPRPIHYEYSRCITVREMARLHGFPDWFRFHVTKWHGARQIGNAVPPPLAHAVGRAVMQAAGLAAKKPRTKIRLGDPSLLALEMGEAAEMFGVAPINGRRNKKGAPKRRQWDDLTKRLIPAE